MGFCQSGIKSHHTYKFDHKRHWHLTICNQLKLAWIWTQHLTLLVTFISISFKSVWNNVALCYDSFEIKLKYFIKTGSWIFLPVFWVYTIPTRCHILSSRNSRSDDEVRFGGVVGRVQGGPGRRRRGRSRGRMMNRPDRFVMAGLANLNPRDHVNEAFLFTASELKCGCESPDWFWNVVNKILRNPLTLLWVSSSRVWLVYQLYDTVASFLRVQINGQRENWLNGKECLRIHRPKFWTKMANILEKRKSIPSLEKLQGVPLKLG